MTTHKRKTGAGSASPPTAGSALRYRVTFEKLLQRCQSRSDRECLCRLVKEVCILACDFDRATAYRELQKQNLPPRARGSLAWRGIPKPPWAKHVVFTSTPHGQNAPRQDRSEAT
jgi:hypothetical protein